MLYDPLDLSGLSSLTCNSYPLSSLELSSITSSFADKPSTIAKKRKPQVIVIDADDGPGQAVIVADDVATEKNSLLVDVLFVTDGEGLIVSFSCCREPRQCNLGWTCFRIALISDAPKFT